MVGFSDLTGKFLLSAMLIMSIFSFIIITQSDNNAPDPLANNSIFNESASLLLNEINESTASANQQYNTFNSEEPKPGFGSIVLVGIVSVGKTFSQIITGFFTAILRLPLIILGIPESIYSLILTWLIIVAIVSAWLLYKLGG